MLFDENDMKLKFIDLLYIHIKWNAALQKQALLDEQTNVFTLKCFIKKKRI